MSAERKTKPRRKMAPSSAGDIIVKRMTLPSTTANTVSSTAGSIVALDTATSAAVVQSAPATEWASFAARYQQFRVRSVRLILEPVNTVSYQATGVTVNHSSLYSGDYIGTSVPGSAAQVFSDEKARLTNTSKRLSYTVDWSRNPNAKLWNPTNAALPPANNFGIAFASSAAAELAVSYPYFTRSVEWVVEFRGSQ
jgi:hypothetical protein